MASRLVKQGRALQKAADAYRDPADPTASPLASTPASRLASTEDSQTASVPAGASDGTQASDRAIISASGNDGEKESGSASKIASTQDSRPASLTAGGSAGRKASEEAGRPASPKRASPQVTIVKDRPVRRRGRPRGPSRVPLSVRILQPLDERLTQAVEDTGLGPQEIVELALDRWLTSHERTRRRSG